MNAWKKEYLENYLYREIPITREMGITVSVSSPERVVLKALLSKNFNHKKTAFAGSLSSLATLAGWGFLFYWFKEMNQNVKIVLQEGAISFLKPVESDFEAICEAPASEALVRLKRHLDKKKMGRIRLESTIYQEEEPAVIFRGSYVVQSA